MRTLFIVCVLLLTASPVVVAELPATRIHLGPEDFTTTTLGREMIEGHAYLIIQAEARNSQVANSLGYCRLRAWFDMQNRITRKVLLLDHDNEILTTIHFSGYTLFKDAPRASRMEIIDHATGQTTVFDLDGLSQPVDPLTMI